MRSLILALGVFALSSLFADAQNQADRMTEAREAAIKDPYAECEPYFYPPVTDMLSNFPTIWQIASMLPGDDKAISRWNSIKDRVPNIPPKGTVEGNFADVDYAPDDPDCWWTYSKCNDPKTPAIPADISTMPEPRTLGYGFDDGPNCSHNAFYDFLREQNQKATMFYIGSNVMDWPLEAQRAVADGHEICIHSWSHHYMTSLQSEDAFAEMYYSVRIQIIAAVKLATGVTPTCWRPPFGDVDDRIRAIANGLGLRTVLWNYDSQDWQVGITPSVTSDSVDQEYQRMIDDANMGKFETEGAMILMHEIDDFTMTQAMKMLPRLQDSFDHIVPVCVGLNITQPYVETNYVFPNFVEYTSGLGSTLAANISASKSASLNPEPTKSSGRASRRVWASGWGVYEALTVIFGFLCSVGFGLAPI